MAFNQHKAEQGERAREAQQSKLRESEQPEENEGNSVSRSVSGADRTVASTPVRATDAASRPSVQQAFAPRSASSNSTNPASRPSNPAQTPVNSAAVNGNAPTLSLRDEALIKAIAQFKNWGDEQVSEVKRRLAANPGPYLARLKGIYDNEVVPTLRTVPGIRDWVSQHPNTVAFQFENAKGEIKGQAIPLSDPRAEIYKIYHGLIMKSVSADSTPFPPPSELFKSDAEVGLEQTEEAFEGSKNDVSRANSSGDNTALVSQFATVMRSPKM